MPQTSGAVTDRETDLKQRCWLKPGVWSLLLRYWSQLNHLFFSTPVRFIQSSDDITYRKPDLWGWTTPTQIQKYPVCDQLNQQCHPHFIPISKIKGLHRTPEAWGKGSHISLRVETPLVQLDANWIRPSLKLDIQNWREKKKEDRSSEGREWKASLKWARSCLGILLPNATVNHHGL